MGIFDRMGRVISSNFNALLDRVDDPGRSIANIIDEMQKELRAARREVVRAVAAEKQLRGKIEELDAEARRWESRAELALSRGDEALAREALAQKKRVVAERDRAEALRAEQRGAALEMKAELERMERKIQEISARKATLAAEIGKARAGGGPEGLGARGGTSPFDELRRLEDQIEGVEASVAAQRELDGVLGVRTPSGLTAAELEAKFRALEGGAAPGAPDPEVEAELDALKRKVRVKE
ncbi:MAG TPA: PspA/IM30 family protein [Polyangiaceae bacterium]|nr:MAG: PspA/IM30 family protein [Pseudomonadota bacterium]HLV65530.1 PspA/IM30 family protein [Polyangiaceae bacterium]